MAGPYRLFARLEAETTDNSTWDDIDAKREMKNFPEATHIVFMRRGNLSNFWPKVLPIGVIGYVRSENGVPKKIRLGTYPYQGEITLENLQKLLCV